MSAENVKERLEEIRKESLSQNPIVPEGQGTKKSPALEGVEIKPGHEIAIPPIKIKK